MRYGLSGRVSYELLEAIHESAVDVLVDCGFLVLHDSTLAGIEGKAEVRIDGRMVRFDHEYLREKMLPVGREQYDASLPGHPCDDFHIAILSGYPMNVQDNRTGEIRPMHMTDVIDGCKLVDALYDRGVRGSAPGIPMDEPEPLQEILAFATGAKYCRAGASSALSARSILWQYRMAEAIGQGFGFGVYINDPLTIAGDSWDQLFIMRKYLGRGCGAGVSSMPMMGLSGPVSLVGSYVLEVATAWGGALIARLATGYEGMGVGFSVWPTDMRTMQIGFGNPEMFFAEMLGDEVNRFYTGKGSISTNAFHSIAPTVDEQSAAQRGAYGMAAALAGKREFHWGGLLAQDLVFSPRQLLVDVELTEYFKFMCGGMPCDVDLATKAAADIKKVGPRGSFLSLDETLTTYRDHMWTGRLFSSESLGAWQSKGKTGFADRARDEVSKLVSEQSYMLADDKQAALDEVVARARHELLG